jgi:hypothetical protein
MEIEIKKYLFDIKESIDSIETYLGEKRDFNVYHWSLFIYIIVSS